MKALVVYYSRTGTTRTLAQAIAGALAADLEPIADRQRRSGPLGWLRCGFEGYRGRLADIGPPEHDPAQYDVVIVGGPIWSKNLSSPVRSYLRRFRGALPKVAFFYTCGGTGNERAFEAMAHECGAEPVATLAVRQADVGRAPADAERFGREITHTLAARAAGGAG